MSNGAAFKMPAISQYGEISGVKLKNLRTNRDERGFFREVVRVTDDFFAGSDPANPPFGQWSHSKMVSKVVKAWHYHHLQTDWWYIPVGLVKTVLIDNRSESPSFGSVMEIIMGEEELKGSYKNNPELTDASPEICVMIPPGVLHGCQVLSSQAHLFYITSHTYNPLDEGRYPFDSSEIGYDWGVDAITCENDRRLFVPQAERASCL
jgi:dTDP-4-dehydrorhamnose 3,5-epimerase